MNKSKEALFDSLVRNAFTFFRQAVIEFESSPNFSVIHFFTAVELFLKARLFLEHWSLIFEKSDAAQWNKLDNGDFNSVGLAETLSRLRRIARLQIPPGTENIFRSLQDHRNKLMHFYHPTYSINPTSEVLAEVAAEQCKGWHSLHKLLTIDWRLEFHTYYEDLAELDRLMVKHRAFLQAKYEAIKPDLKLAMADGAVFQKCEACGYSTSYRIDDDPVETNLCIVCSNRTKCLIVECPKCGKDIQVEDLGEGVCQNCNHKIDLDFLLSTYPAANEDEPGRSFCSNCEFQDQPSTIKLNTDSWLCLVCLEVAEQSEHCEWCDELVTGDASGSYLFGCVRCDGKLGWDSDSSE